METILMIILGIILLPFIISGLFYLFYITIGLGLLILGLTVGLFDCIKALFTNKQ